MELIPSLLLRGNANWELGDAFLAVAMDNFGNNLKSLKSFQTNIGAFY
jgi:hypothetical protein